MFKKILKNELYFLQKQNINVKIFANENFIYCGKCDSKIIQVLDLVSLKYLDKLKSQLHTQEKIYSKTQDYDTFREICSLKKQIANFKTFSNRLVQEIYDGILPEEYPCKIIQIAGKENGKYWTVKEFKKKLSHYQSLC